MALLKGFIRYMHEQKVTKLGSCKVHFPKSDQDGVYIWLRIENDGVGVLRGQRHIPSKN